jgi:F-box domain
MLSLKSTSTSQVATGKTRLVDLPSELIKSVLDHVCNLDDLLSASLVSKSLRDAILPILYGSINVTFTTRIKRNGETSLDFLSKRPHLQKHIREVIIRPALSNVDHDRQEFSKFRRLSPGLANLRCLR